LNGRGALGQDDILQSLSRNGKSQKKDRQGQNQPFEPSGMCHFRLSIMGSRARKTGCCCLAIRGGAGSSGAPRTKRLLDKKREASLKYHKDCDLFFFFDLFLPIIPLFCYHSASVLPFFR
jgi:hypothetical protein